MHAAESRIIPFFVKRRREEERILRFCAVPANSKFSDLKIGAVRAVQRQRPTTQWRKVTMHCKCFEETFEKSKVKIGAVRAVQRQTPATQWRKVF